MYANVVGRNHIKFLSVKLQALDRLIISWRDLKTLLPCVALFSHIQLRPTLCLEQVIPVHSRVVYVIKGLSFFTTSSPGKFGTLCMNWFCAFWSCLFSRVVRRQTTPVCHGQLIELSGKELACFSWPWLPNKHFRMMCEGESEVLGATPNMARQLGICSPYYRGHCC